MQEKPAKASNPEDNVSSSQPPRAANALIVVAKRPAPGQTKTRLSPPLSPEQAAALYECFLRDTLDLIRRTPDVQPLIAYLPADAQAYFAGLAPDFECLLQEGPDLGARLDHALTRYLALGYERVAIMNSDGPTLPVACLAAAFDALRDGADVALGPADDGGYYLIGLKRPGPRLLREVAMSTPHVAADTLALAAAEGLTVALLPTWYDVDDSVSLARLEAELTVAPPEVAPHTRALLDAWRREQGGKGESANEQIGRSTNQQISESANQRTNDSRITHHAPRITPHASPSSSPR